MQTETWGPTFDNGNSWTEESYLVECDARIRLWILQFALSVWFYDAVNIEAIQRRTMNCKGSERKLRLYDLRYNPGICLDRLRIADVLAEIVPNTSIEGYRYTNLLGNNKSNIYKQVFWT
jgi:hypothetical protein